MDPATPEKQPSSWRRAVAFFWDLLFSRRKRPADPILEVLPSFDVEALLAEMRIEQRAAADGKYEIPATDDVQMAGAERLIVQRIDQVVREGKSQLETHLLNLNQRIQSADITQDCFSIRALPEALSHELDELIRRYEETIGPLRDRRQALRRELHEFRARFGINREPRILHTHVLHAGVLAVMIAIETGLNGFYLAAASPQGLVGGFSTALGIALINVMYSFALGRIGSWVMGERPALRVTGALAILCLISTAVGLNLTVAHAREVSTPSITLDHIIGPALDHLRTAPLGLAKLDSWLLLFFGMSFAAIAFYEGLRWADPTVGYVARYRRAEEANDDYLHARSDLDTSGHAELERMSNALREKSERVRYRVEAVRSDVTLKGMLKEKAQNFFHHAVETCNTMLAAYRTENRRHRTTQPPAYFQKPWRHQEPALVVIDLSQDLALAQTREGEWKAIAADHESIGDSLQARYEAFVKRARDLRALDDEPFNGEDAHTDG